MPGIPPPPLPPIPFTPETLADRWACSPNQVRALCRQGRLGHFRVGRGLFRIPQEAVIAYERLPDLPLAPSPPRIVMAPPRARTTAQMVVRSMIHDLQERAKAERAAVRKQKAEAESWQKAQRAKCR
jgi:excisionase family DNA binding protein